MHMKLILVLLLYIILMMDYSPWDHMEKVRRKKNFLFIILLLELRC